MTAESVRCSVRYVPRHADPADAGDVGSDTARDHALALLAASPVYSRVAHLLGLAADSPGERPAAFDGADAPGTPRTEIAARLGRLPAGWHVLPAAGVDHLVVGPAGVFAVAVQHHLDAQVSVEGDTIRVNGRNQRWVADLRRRANRLGKRLTAATGQRVAVHPVLAVSGAQRGFAVKQQPRDVTVVNRRTITPYLHAQPRTWDTAAVERLMSVARLLADGQ